MLLIMNKVRLIKKILIKKGRILKWLNIIEIELIHKIYRKQNSTMQYSLQLSSIKMLVENSSITAIFCFSFARQLAN